MGSASLGHPLSAGLSSKPVANGLYPPERHLADVQVGAGQAPGGAFALQGSAAHPEGFGQFIDAISQRLDSGPALSLAVESIGQPGQDGGEIGQPD
jgi:hypothetical protein